MTPAATAIIIGVLGVLVSLMLRRYWRYADRVEPEQPAPATAIEATYELLAELRRDGASAADIDEALDLLLLLLGRERVS